MRRRIDKFEGEYYFLSNFYIIPIEYEGFFYPSSEHAFQAAKIADVSERKEFVMREFLRTTPGQAKRKGRKIELREDWEDVKLDIMTEILRYKFMIHVNLAGKLLATGDVELIEGTTWHDTYWGIDLETGEGKNHLGQILMQIRKELQDVIVKNFPKDPTYISDIELLTDASNVAYCSTCGEIVRRLKPYCVWCGQKFTWKNFPESESMKKIKMIRVGKLSSIPEVGDSDSEKCLQTIN